MFRTMKFIEADIETIVHHLNQLNEDTAPKWGSMTAQKMVEHLTDGVWTGMGKKKMTCPYEGEKLQRSYDFLMSENPMPVMFKAHFVDDNAPLRNDEFALAVDEFIEAWCDFEEYAETNPDAVHTHPVFGDLNLSEWRWMHRKHFTHHFTQFGIEITDLIQE